MTLNEATRQYQYALEACRSDPDDGHFQDELEKSEKTMNALWLEHIYRQELHHG